MLEATIAGNQELSMPPQYGPTTTSFYSISGAA
jgi:hypothetical protein